MTGQDIDEGGSELGAHVVVEIARTRNQRCRLTADGIDDTRMAVAQHGDALCRREVQITAIVAIEQPAAFAANEDGLAAARGGASKHPLFDGCALVHDQLICVPAPASG